ncbi:MAG: YHYH domain-containing protein [Bacilli bacterium]|jgi:hypothetical protein|nr:YHYH domain-containing protein [Bacilli bacterium]
MENKNLKLKILIIIIIILIPTKVLAHPGRLDSKGCHYCRTNCAKWGLEIDEYHCHEGGTYSNSKGEIYDESGTKISDGNSSSDEQKESGEYNNNNNSSSEDTSYANNDNKQSYNNSVNNTKQETSKTIQKSEDTSLKYIKINDKKITIANEMTYKTNKKNINIDIKTNDSKATIEFNNPELKIGNNEIVIKVIAEAGNIKEYKLIVTREETLSNVIIKKFILGSSEVKFKNNKASINKLANESSFEYSYELSNVKAKLLLYVNDKEVTKLDNIKDKDIIKLVVIDEDDNKNIYEIEVNEMSKIESAIINFIAYTIVVITLLSPIIIIVYIKKKKKDN